MANPSDILPNTPIYDPEAHYKRVMALYEQYPIKDAASGETHAIDVVKQALKGSARKGSTDFLTVLVSVVETLFEQDKLYWPSPPERWDLSHAERLLSKERLRVATEGTVQILTAVLRDYIPGDAFSFVDNEHDRGLPLISLAPDPTALIHGLCVEFMNLTVPRTQDDFPAFPRLQKQLIQNICTANGLTPDAPQKPGKLLKLPKDFDIEPLKLADRFLRDTPFHYLLTLSIMPEAPSMPIMTDAIRFEHAWCLAAPGAGKTTLILKEIVDNLKRDNPPAMVILDPKGTITSQIASLAVFDPADGKHKDRILIVDPTDTIAPPAINMFHPGNAERFRMYSEAQRRQVENQTITLFSYVFASRENALTPQQSTCFNYLVRLLFSIEGANINTMLDLISDQLYQKNASLDASPWKAFIERQQPIAQRWFRDQYYNHLIETRKGIATRLYGLLEKPELEAVFSSRERKLDMFDALQTGKTVLVKVPKALLGRDGMELFGRYIIALTLASAFERITIPDKTKWHPAFLYLDEFQEFADDEKSAELLQLAREFNLGVFVAHQDIPSQLSESLRSTLATNTTTKYVSAVGASDANFMAREMHCEPEFFHQAVKNSSCARFAWYVRGHTPQPVILEVSLRAIEKEPVMSLERHNQMLERNRAQIAEPREDRTLGVAPAPTPAKPAMSPDSSKQSDPDAAASQIPRKDPGEPSDAW